MLRFALHRFVLPLVVALTAHSAPGLRAQVVVGDIQSVATMFGTNQAELSLTTGVVRVSRAPGWDVTNGEVLTQTAPPTVRGGIAQVTYAPIVEPDVIGASLALRSDVHSGITAPTGSYWVLTRAEGSVEVVFSSVEPVPVTVEMRVSESSYLCAGCDNASARVEVVGTGVYQCNTFSCPGAIPAPCTFSVPARVDSNGLRIRLIGRALNAGDTGRCFGASSAASFVEVRLRRRDGAASYGASCGASLSIVPQAALVAAETFEIVDSTFAAPFGTLLVGTQQLALVIPPWPCPVRTDPIASIPLVFSGGRTTFTVPRLPPPGALTLQVLSYSGSTLHTSNGLQF